MLCELVLAVTAILTADARASSAELPFQVIVNAANPITSVRRADLSAMLMKRNRRWSDGTAVVPVDQPPASRVREAFSRAVHEKSVAFTVRYWQRLLFSGRGVPPDIAGNDGAVIAVVASRRGAIGYVSRGTSLPAGVKAIAVHE